MTRGITAEGRGKLIVFGEHAVVYGRPAVACGLPRGASATIRRSDTPNWSITHPGGILAVNDDARRAGEGLLRKFDLRSDELEIEIELSIPVGAGLGSSAAMAVALARCAARLQNIDESIAGEQITEAVAASEAVFHGNASGIDQQAAMGGGFFTFSKTEDGPDITTLDVPSRHWLIARVAPSQSTSKMVAGVASLRDRRPAVVEAIFDNIATIAADGARALQDGRWSDVGELMNLNQGLLNALGVSSPTIEAACSAARKAGSPGAKLTGAGGGGCIIALAGDDGQVERALAAFGDVYPLELPAVSS